MSEVRLRDVTDADLPIFFEFECDAEACRMAAFTAEDPTDREAFDAHWTRIRSDDAIIIRTIEHSGCVAGYLAKFDRFKLPEVSFWIGRSFWRRGVATAALNAFLRVVPDRPLYARAARDNIASLRVLEKCGFKVDHYERAFADARGEEIEEAVLALK